MSSFDELLCRLIRDNRRVIIPDIGAFITNAPDENAVFSPLLKHNDGFLEDEMRKDGIANPAVLLSKLAENIISVIEKGQHYHIAGLGYFFKDGSIRFVFEETEKNAVVEYSDDTYVPEKSENKNKLLFIAGLCLCLTGTGFLLSVIFNINTSKKQRSDMFAFQTEKPGNQFVIVDKSDNCDNTDDLTPFPPVKNYHVVVACFEEKDNAEKFVLQCRKNGYDNAEILCVTTVLYPVSIGDFASLDEALDKKQEYDSIFEENSMIFKTK
jgi:hypothetical protein